MARIAASWTSSLKPATQSSITRQKSQFLGGNFGVGIVLEAVNILVAVRFAAEVDQVRAVLGAARWVVAEPV